MVAGDLYLVGGGDPLLTSDAYPVENDLNPVTNPTSLDALADAVVAAGVQRVEGAVVGDATRYDDEWYVPSWSADIRGIEAGPYDALLVNDARVTGDPQRADDPAEAAAREFTQLLDERGVDGRRDAARPAPPTATPACSPRSSRRRCGRSSARCSPRATTTPPSCWSRRSGWPRVAPGHGEPGLAAIRATLERWGMPDRGASSSTTARG